MLNKWATAIPNVAETTGADRPNRMNGIPRRFRSLNFLDAVIPIPRGNKQSSPWNSLSSSAVMFDPYFSLTKPMMIPPKRRNKPGFKKTSWSSSPLSIPGGFLVLSAPWLDSTTYVPSDLRIDRT